MSDVRNCGQCGATLPVDSPHGVCPSCLMRLGMGVADATGTAPHQRGRQPPFAPPKPGELSVHFPQLEILELIGQGGMGAVYKARQVSLDRIVALKILPPHAGDDGSFASRFEREARALARLSHPNIVAVFDSGRAGNFFYFVMEFIDGVNLREAIRAGTLSPSEALAIVPQICDALQYAHDEGIVHRDIKPENVLIDKKGNTKIADFGLARLLGPTDDLTLTGTHQVMGTPRYMAPEQMEGSHEVDHRADIYSLGVVFYEMLTGELPLGRFDGPSKKVQIDVRLDEVVFRTLEKEPARRYQHASEVKTDVQAICGANGGATGGRFVRRGHVGHYEYKSKTHWFGWPLVHVAYGRDPKTGKIMRAKGIIAIGNLAYGVLAIGNFACGAIALGSFSVGGIAMGGGAVGSLAMGGGAIGLFSFGGLSIGLLMAVGGIAMGLGLSIGGLAVGTVAKGGMAIGWYSTGGLALGAHAVGANVMHRDTPAEALFSYIESAGAPLEILGCLLIGIISLGIGLAGSWRMLGRKNERSDSHAPPRMTPPKPGIESPRRSGWGIVVVVAMIGVFVTICALPILFVGWRFVALQRSTTTYPDATSAAVTQTWPPPNVVQARIYQQQFEAGDVVASIVWTEDGPTINNNPQHIGQSLTPDQLETVNQILGDAHRAYLEIEKENMQQEHNAVGHWVTTVSIEDAAKLAALENEFWTKIDAVVDLNMQNVLRFSLVDLQSDDDVGVLGFAGHQGTVEIWKVGSWFHWKVTATGNRPAGPGFGTAESTAANSGRSSGNLPRLPIRLRRFWTEPAATVEPAADREGQ